MKKFFSLTIYAFVLVIFFLSCSFTEPETKTEDLTIVSWNVQNLFDGSDNGFEYAEFQNSSGWNNEKYLARLHGISSALGGETKPDILALMEVENRAVIEQLGGESFLNYRWTFFANAPDSSIGLGLLSSLPLTETRAHSFYSTDGTIPRPIAEVWVDTGHGPLVLFVCHLKSKLEGALKTTAARRAAAALITRRLLEIERENPLTPVVILGDLNENCDEFIRIGEEYICTLLPDTENAALLIQGTPGKMPHLQDFLVLSEHKPPRTLFFPGRIALYSPWLEEADIGEAFGYIHQGSYYYKDTWETIDHFLLNAALFDGSSWNYGHFRVLGEPPFTNGRGFPEPYNLRTGNGLSDHLPILLYLYKH